MWTLDDVLDLLDEHHQRATYGAVGQVVRRPALFLMQGCPRDQRHSWIVAQASGLPTGYAEDEMHPALRDNEDVLASGEELELWLRGRRPNPPVR